MEKEKDVAVYQGNQANTGLEDIDYSKYALDEESLTNILAAARLRKVESLSVETYEQICEDPIRCKQIVEELKANGVKLYVGQEIRMHEQIDKMLEYMDKLNHRPKEELKKADLSVAIRVAEETVELPLNADVFNAIYNILKDLK